MKQNKHAINSGTISTWVLVAILIVVLFQVLAALFPTMVDAGTTLNSSGFPLGELFTSGGAVWYILAAGLIFVVVQSFMKKK